MHSILLIFQYAFKISANRFCRSPTGEDGLKLGLSINQSVHHKNFVFSGGIYSFISMG